jgi:hypothetical protein
MKLTTALIAALALVFLTPGVAAAKDKKKHQLQRGMLEKMQSVPCGVKERGLTSLGGLYAGIGVQHVNSMEKLCPQYLFRTDQMDYHVRPMDLKHPALLPVGQEAEFKIKKNKLYLRVPDGDRKMRAYEVVSMEPVNSEGETERTSYKTASRPAATQAAPAASTTTQAAPATNTAAPVVNQPATAPAQQTPAGNAPANQSTPAANQSVPAASQSGSGNQMNPAASQASPVANQATAPPPQ